MKNIVFQLVRGIWNPAEGNHSWIVEEDFSTPKEARAALDNLIAERLGLERRERVTHAHRQSYRGSPLAILKVVSQVLDKVEGKQPELAE